MLMLNGSTISVFTECLISLFVFLFHFRIPSLPVGRELVRLTSGVWELFERTSKHRR